MNQSSHLLRADLLTVRYLHWRLIVVYSVQWGAIARLDNPCQTRHTLRLLAGEFLDPIRLIFGWAY